MSRVSLLIPAYKPDHFHQALESALAQTRTALEIVISDDCPTDAVRQAAGELLDHPLVRYERNKPGKGLAGNYLHLAQLARGDWLKYLDDDDTLYEDCLARMSAAVKEKPEASLCFSGVRFTWPDGRVREMVPELPRFIPGREFFLQRSFDHSITLFTRMLIRKDAMLAVAQHQPPARMISLDELAGLSACALGDVIYLPEVTCVHRIHDSGYSGVAETQVLMDDLAYALLPPEIARPTGRFTPQELDAWRKRMLVKVSRGTLTKLYKRGLMDEAREFLAHLRTLDAKVARKTMLSPRVLMRYIKGLRKQARDQA